MSERPAPTKPLTCKTCDELNAAQFYYNSRTKRYYEHCKTCWNTIRRTDYDAKKKARFEHKEQPCRTCGQTLPIDAFLNAHGTALFHKCVFCRTKRVTSPGEYDPIIDPMTVVELELYPKIPYNRLTPEQRERCVMECKRRLGLA